MRCCWSGAAAELLLLLSLAVTSLRPMSARKSALVTLPSGPVPTTPRRSRPFSIATRRTAGDARGLLSGAAPGAVPRGEEALVAAADGPV